MSAIAIAADFVRQHEGCKLESYQDSIGRWTIGYGHTGPEIKPGLIWTQEQANNALQGDLEKTVGIVARLSLIPLSDQQAAALMSLVFNIGGTALVSSQLIAKVQAREWLGAAHEFPRWDHAGGNELKGLLIRRFEEAALFLRGS